VAVVEVDGEPPAEREIIIGRQQAVTLAALVGNVLH
jgi:hypothetical protein